MEERLYLKVESDFSEAAVEEAMIVMRNHHHKEPFACTLNVSVFDVRLAVSMMIDDHFFRNVRYVHITPELRDGEWSIVDELNQCYIKSGVY